MKPYTCTVVDLLEDDALADAVAERCPFATECGAVVEDLALVPDSDYAHRFAEVEAFLVQHALDNADRGNYCASEPEHAVGISRDSEGYWATFDWDGERVCSFVGVSAEKFRATAPESC